MCGRPVHAGGVTGLKPHLRFRRDLSWPHRLPRPDGRVAHRHGRNVHVDTWVPNFGIQEYSGYTDATYDVFPHAWSYERGYMQPNETPGHGTDIDEELSPRNTPTNPPTCRSPGWRTAP
jgi:mannonate dehydratase